MRYFLLFFVFLAGCRVGPRYEPPQTAVPEDWKHTHAHNSEATFENYWWEVFDDELLNELELLAVESNPNLYIALERIYEARALAGVEGANLYPQLNLDGNYTSTGFLMKANLPSGIQIPGFPSQIPPFRVHQMQYLLALNLNYEIDLWGRLHDQYDSARYFTESQVYAYWSAMLSLTADVASTYFQVRALDAEIDLLYSNIETRRKNLDLTQNRYKQGLVTLLDVTQAEVDLANVEASLQDAIRGRNLAENQLALLTGQLASNFCVAHRALEGAPPIIPPGIPSTVLLQRPDISEAERQMASEHALINAAYASFFPSFSLTGALGFLSPDAEHFLKWISRYWSIAVNGRQIVFDGGRDYYNLRAAWSRFLEASGAYQQTVLTAFKEVEDALTNIEQQAKQAESLQKAAQAAKKATEISKERYKNGLAIYLEVVENERLQLQAESNLVNVQGLQYVSTIQLIKALGGSWAGALLVPTDPCDCETSDGQ